MKSGKLYRKSGTISIVIIALSGLFVIVLLVMFAVCIMYINMYSIVYNYKMDLYNLNRSAIISINKAEGKFGIYEYEKQKYQNLKLLY